MPPGTLRKTLLLADWLASQPFGRFSNVGLAHLSRLITHLLERGVGTELRNWWRQMFVERVAVFLIDFAVFIAMTVVKSGLVHVLWDRS